MRKKNQCMCSRLCDKRIKNKKFGLLRRKQASTYLKNLHRTWLIRKYVKSITQERKAQLKEKVIAESIFKGKKASYKKSVGVPFVSSRLGSEQEEKLTIVLQNNMQSVKKKVLYILPVTKYDRHGYKPRFRILVLTQESVFLFDKTTLKLKQQAPIKNLKTIYISNLMDGFAVLKLPCMNKKDKGDLIINCDDYVIEMAVKATLASGDKNLITIFDKESITHEMFGGKNGTLFFTNGPDTCVTKNKNGNLTITSASS